MVLNSFWVPMPAPISTSLASYLFIFWDGRSLGIYVVLVGEIGGKREYQRYD